MYTVYAAKLYTAQTNAIANNAAGVCCICLYETDAYSIYTDNSCSIDIAVSGNCNSKADAKARR